LKGIASLVISLGFLIILTLINTQANVLANMIITEKLLKVVPDIHTNSTVFVALADTIRQYPVFYMTLLYTIIFIWLAALLILILISVTTLFQEMDDFSEPPTAIWFLEERIKALRAKSQ
jgi:hypothetical protein